VIRSEVGRTLLDLVSATRADRLRIGRDLLARAGELLAALRPATAPGATTPGARGRRGAKAAPPDAAPVDGAPVEADGASPTARVPAAERRAAAIALAAIWRDVARDLALVSLGESGEVRQIDLLDDLETVARRLPAGFPQAQLRRLDVAGERLEGNVSPELVVDELVLGWVA
jgi:hypothetical protein